jgi:hypothetical protein
MSPACTACREPAGTCFPGPCKIFVARKERLAAKGPQDPCPIAAMVTEDIQARSAVGLRKYGVTLGRTDLTRKQWLQHAYEEALDLACYLRRLIEDEARTEPMAKKQVTPPIDRVFCALFPVGVVWSDRFVDLDGDYKRLARMPYDTLELQFEADCPYELRAEVTSQAKFYQDRRGQEYQVTRSGQTVVLGSAIKEPA